MIDWHCHILPGIDDGPAATDEAVEMALALARAGFTSVYCTPHMLRGLYDADNATIRQAVTHLQGELERRGIGLRLFPGREYCQDEFLESYLLDPLLLGDTRYLLLEIPNHSLPDLVMEACSRIMRHGFTPMIAHPERCRLFGLPATEDGRLMEWLRRLMPHSRGGASLSSEKDRQAVRRENSLLSFLLEHGCGFQGNIGSFGGRYGEGVRQRALGLRSLGIYTHMGTDAHCVNHIEEQHTLP